MRLGFISTGHPTLIGSALHFTAAVLPRSRGCSEQFPAQTRRKLSPGAVGLILLPAPLCLDASLWLGMLFLKWKRSMTWACSCFEWQVPNTMAIGFFSTVKFYRFCKTVFSVRNFGFGAFFKLSACNRFSSMNVQKFFMETLNICIRLATLGWAKIVQPGALRSVSRRCWC